MYQPDAWTIIPSRSAFEIPGPEDLHRAEVPSLSITLVASKNMICIDRYYFQIILI